MAVTHDAETGMTTIPFEISNGRLPYKDAIVIPTTEFENMTAKQLLDEQQKRFDNWVHTLENPPEAPNQEPETLKEPEA